MERDADTAGDGDPAALRGGEEPLAHGRHGGFVEIRAPRRHDLHVRDVPVGIDRDLQDDVRVLPRRQRRLRIHRVDVLGDGGGVTSALPCASAAEGATTRHAMTAARAARFITW